MLFILVTLAAAWIGWCSAIVRDRLAIIKVVQEQPDGSVVVWTSDMSCFMYPPQTLLPVWKRWLGDQNIAQITFPVDALDDELIAARRCFPEAYIGRVGEWKTRWPENSPPYDMKEINALFETPAPGAN